jgi:hypothetical protein
MMHSLRRLVTPYKMEDEEQRYIRTILYVILITALITAGIATLGSLAAGYRTSPIVTTFAFAVCLFLLWLTWQGRLTFPRLALPLLAFSTATYLAYIGDGVRDEVMYVYPLTIVLAGLLSGKGSIVLYTALSLAAIAALVYGEVNHLIVTPFSAGTSYFTLAFLGVLLVFIGVLLYITIGNLTNSLGRARRNERELAESNRQLQAIRASLEDRVAERTRNAEAARQEAEMARCEAEAARREAEAEKDRVQAIHALDDIMRGEQDMRVLANNVMGHLCRYLGAQVGALFVLDQARAVLELAGGYAYAPDERLATQFKLGEGLVGQAALERRALTLAPAPGNGLIIASGFGQHTPRSILIAPFLYEGQVGGVMELGALAEFAPTQIEFLGRAAGNIAIAFNTAQTRARLNDLLAQTQQQAEELQAQEEELRAINEELQAQAKSARRA